MFAHFVFNQENLSMKHIHPRTLYSKIIYIVKLGYTGFYHFFLFFAPKHRPWVRTASARWFYGVPTNNVLSKILKTFFFPIKFSIFNAEKKISILHGQVFRNVKSMRSCIHLINHPT